MPIDVVFPELDGGQQTSNIKTFSVQEDATPIDPASTFGGVGQITVEMNEFPDAKFLIGSIILGDGSRGKTSGIVRSLSSTNEDLSVVADSTLALFNSEHTLHPYVGTLGNAIQHYCDIAGITNDVITESGLVSRPVVYPGYKGNLWVFMKQLLAKEQVELSLVFNRIYVRSLRLLTANTDRNTSFGWSTDSRTAAKTIEVSYYNYTYGAQKEIYPLTTDDPTIYQVDAGETVRFTQQLNASLFTVNQPTCIDFVNNTTYPGTNGVYSVIGNDELPITAAQWVAQGGSVRVEMTDDPSIVEIVIKGASMTQYAPYRIAMSSGGGNVYNSLHITGTAVVSNKRKITLHTGASASVTGEQVGITVDNPLISTKEDAYSLGMKTAGMYAGLNYSVNGTAMDINRNGEGRELIQATVADFNQEVPAGTTAAEFSAAWVGATVADFNTFWQSRVDLLWENQMFGNAAGARVITNDAVFRIDSATTTEGPVQFSATLDTIVADFNERWVGATAADFSAEVLGKNCKNFSMTPLRRANG